MDDNTQTVNPRANDVHTSSRRNHGENSQRLFCNQPEPCGPLCDSRQNTNVKKQAPVENGNVKHKEDVQLPRDVNKRNLFVKLGLFFSEPDDSQTVVEQLLDDQLKRGLISIDKLISELSEYCSQFHDIPNNNCRSFLHASFMCVTWCYNSDTSHDVVQRMGYLLKNHSQSLVVLLGLVCKPEFSCFALFVDAFQDAFKLSANVNESRRKRVLDNLEAFVDVVTRLRVRQCDSIKFIDMKLGFGETPLIAAARARRADTIALLSRYGAQTETTWLSFQNCLEVLLFTPNMSYIDEQQLADIKACIPHVLAIMPYVDMKRLRELSKDYYPVSDNWEELLKPYACTDKPPSLRHSCRVRIRQKLNCNWALPGGIQDLPLPKPVIQYLDIESS